ncbi:MAG: hypothetical protein H8E83_06410 [Planctomycetes bacterium]|nr:hypothetical protein [Planctomycetota bacterium]
MTTRNDGRPVMCNGENSLPLSKLDTSAFDENMLQHHIAQNTNILPISELEPGWSDSCCVAREFPTSAGPIDLLLVNAYGRLTIVETKLFKNPESRREVLAQALDYAAALHNMTYEELGNAVRRKNPELSDKADPLFAFATLNCLGAEDIDQEVFHDRVCTDLEVGQFLILIVGEGIKKRLCALVDYFDKISHLGFKVGLVSVEQWKTNDNAIVLIPKIVGTIEREARIWTPDPNSAAAQEIAEEEVKTANTPSGKKRLKMTEGDAIIKFRTSITELENGSQILKNIDSLSEQCEQFGLVAEHSDEGSSCIFYYVELTLDDINKFNLLQCNKTGTIGNYNFLQYRCSKFRQLPDSIWIDHWTKLGKITGAGTLVKKPTKKPRMGNNFYPLI